MSGKDEDNEEENKEKRASGKTERSEMKTEAYTFLIYTGYITWWSNKNSILFGRGEASQCVCIARITFYEN